MYRSRLALTAAALLLSVAGCDNATTCDAGCGPADVEVFIANQGNFLAGDGALARYDPEAGRVDSTTALGGLVQSATFHDGRIYVVVTTSNRVDVFDAGSLTRVAQISVAAPRYMAFVSDSKAYVTSQFYDFGGSVRPDLVTVVNPETGATLDTVQVGGNAEGLAIVGSRAYVTTGGFSDTERVVVLDTATDDVVDTIEVGCSPRLALPDAEGDVFIVCADLGGADEIVVLDGPTGAEEARIATGGSTATFGFAQDASLSAAAHELYVAQIDGRVLRIDTRTNAITATLGPFGADPIGAVAYDAQSQGLYVARAPAGLEFTAGGYITVHDRMGVEIARFRSGGIAPSHLITRAVP
jgi:DNA-binding beta-propeller fold protein YncE